MKISLSGVYICIYYCLPNALFWVIYTSSCAYVQWWCYLLEYIRASYLLLIIPWWMCYLYRSVIMLYSQHPPSSNKTKLAFIWCDKKVIMLKQMFMNMKWLTWLFTYIRLLVWWLKCIVIVSSASQLVSGLNGKSTENVFILCCRASKTVNFGWPVNALVITGVLEVLSWCMGKVYVSILACLVFIWSFHILSKQHCLGLCRSAHWYLFFTDFLFIIFFTFSLINIQFFVQHWLFICSVVPVWPIVYVIVIIACGWLFFKFMELVMEVLFSWYLCWLYVFSVSCDCSSCFCDVDMVWSVMMILIIFPFS